MLCALMFCFFYAEAQFPKGLKGPAAKNYKPWLDKYKKPSVFVQSLKTNSRYKGTQAKNQKAWLRNARPITVARANNPRLKGPAAKNWKPWTKRNELQDKSLADQPKKVTRRNSSQRAKAKK